MYCRPTIAAVFLCLGTGLTAGAQDSMPARLVQEQTSPVVGLRDRVYNSPALKAYQRENTWSNLSASYRRYTQDQYLQQEGSGRQTFMIHSETYLKPKAGLTIWGQAYYTGERREDVKFSETADYELVYPYVMADSVGGDLKSETYAFNGGLAKAFGAWQLGAGVGFRGLQEYRDRDPRPKNISSRLDLSLAASRRLNQRYVLALDLNGSKYGQENRLSFVNEIGSPLVYHDAGLGAYNEFLAGARLSANFTGWECGASLRFAPVRYKGWFAGAAIRQWRLNKLLSGIIYETGKVREQYASGNLGYLYQQGGEHFMAELTAVHRKRKGLEAKFSNRDGEVGIVRISEDLRYQHDHNSLAVRSVYGRTGGAFDWFLGAEGNFHDHAEQYVQPDRDQAYRKLTVGLDVTARKQWRNTMLSLQLSAQQQEMLYGDYSWPDVSRLRAIFTMLHTNFAYLTASGMQYGGGLRVDFPLTDRLACYVRTDAGYHTGIGKKEVRVMAGFQF